MELRQGRFWVAGSSLVAAFVFLIAASTAGAVSTHEFSTSFGSAGSSPSDLYPLTTPISVAVDRSGGGSNGDVYVGDPANAWVEKFDSTGQFLLMFGKGVNSGTGNPDVCTNAGPPTDVCVPGTPANGSGSPVGAFGTPAFLAVDDDPSSPSSGDVYVADTGDNLVQKFAPDGALIAAWGDSSLNGPAPQGQLDGSSDTNGNGPFGPLAGIAVDSAGNLDVFETSPQRMFQFAQDGSFVTDFSTPRGSSARGIAVDAAGDFYKVNGEPSVEKLTATGTDIGQVTASVSTTGLALDTSRDDLYVDNGGSIDHYAFGPTGEVAGTGCAPAPLSGCAPTDSFGSGDLSGAAGLDVDPQADRVYAADTGNGRIAVFVPHALPPSQAETAFAAPRTDTGARLNGYVDPEGETLTYRFEYSEDGGGTWITLPDQEDDSEARKQIVVGEQLSNLTPDTTYLYRFSAENPAGAAPQGAEKSFTTRTSAEMQLPQRGVELVNTPEKGNQHVFFPGFPSGDGSSITADGNRLVWTVAGGAPGGTSGTFNAFLATRGSSGWRSTPLVPPASEQVGGGKLKYRPEFASPDFTHFIFRTEEPGLPGTGQPPSTYVRLDDHQHQEVLAHFDVNTFSTPIDATSDTAHVLHTAEDANVLEDIGSGTPEVVGLMPAPNESPPACGIHFGTEFAGFQESAYAYPGYHWIATTDASRAYFQTKGEDCEGPEGLYVRNRTAGTTTKIAPSAAFIRATADGRSAFFTTSEALAGDDGNSDRDVYEWTEGEGLTCLTCIVADANLESPPGNVRVSDDFSHIYFLSRSQLVPGMGKQGDSNLYVVSGGALRFVADPNDALIMKEAGQMQMSTDGNVMLFLSREPLTADRVASSCTNSEEGPHRCRELYRYDDRDGSIECLSCLHDGTTSKDVFTENNGGLPFHISADGNTVAFTTAEPLVGRDINGDSDVYEWRTGALGLITDGETEFAGAFAAPVVEGVDADGSNIFFLVADPGLTGYEQDGVDNVYDARVGGGFPRPVPVGHCSEESCQGPLSPVPPVPGAGSATSGGLGNVHGGGCSRKRGRAKPRCARKHGRHHHPHRARHKGGAR